MNYEANFSHLYLAARTTHHKKPRGVNHDEEPHTPKRGAERSWMCEQAGGGNERNAGDRETHASGEMQTLDSRNREITVNMFRCEKGLIWGSVKVLNF